MSATLSKHVEVLKGAFGIAGEIRNEWTFLSDLEDDVWGTLSDSADGALFYLHWSHLQRVF